MGLQSYKHLVQPVLPAWHLSRSPSKRNIGFLAPWNAFVSEILEFGGRTSCPSHLSGDLVDGLGLVVHIGVESPAANPPR